MEKNKSKEKLKGNIQNEVTELFEKVLDFAEVAILLLKLIKDFVPKF